MTDRRFTDKEVALILRRASDLEEKSSSTAVSSGQGLTLADLEEIASEAGIDPKMVSRAVAEMESPKGLDQTSFFVGPGTVQREVRAIPGKLSREELAEMFRTVDAEVADQGTVVEALGNFRWTSKGRFLSTQVSMDSAKGETLMRVEERYNGAVQGILHGLPTGYGFLFGLVAVTEGLSLGVLPESLVLLGATAAGWGIGTSIWRFISSRSRSRVQHLAERLGLKSRELTPPAPEGE